MIERLLSFFQAERLALNGAAFIYFFLFLLPLLLLVKSIYGLCCAVLSAVQKSF